MNKIYFKNLNGIRFLLASLVLLHHIAVVMQVCGIATIYQKIDALKAFGPVAVSLFFALSGFLITILLLKEKETTSTISLRRFYKARARRILPIYYFIVLVHLYILPYTGLYNLETKLLLMDAQSFSYARIELSAMQLHIWYFTLLPQVALALMVATANTFVPAGHVWSIGVEEVFYFIYPILLKKYAHKFKKLMLYLFGLYYAITLIVFITVYLVKVNIITHTLCLRVVNFSIIMIIYNRVNCMFIGAVAAYIFIHKDALLTRLTSIRIYYGSIIGILFLFIIGARVPFLTHELYCIFFVCILLYLAKNNPTTFLEIPFMSYLGKISYGIYMYQMIAIFFAVYLYKSLAIHWLIIFPISFILTILISILSYETLEKKIMNK